MTGVSQTRRAVVVEFDNVYGTRALNKSKEQSKDEQRESKEYDIVSQRTLVAAVFEEWSRWFYGDGQDL